MAETSIAWCDYTFNGWIGCEKVSPACRSCYASVDTYARVSASRGLPLWGPDSTRHVTSTANWLKPLAWDRRAASTTSDHKPRVFAHSLSDVAEDRRDLDEPRAWLSELIRRTRNLQWLLLTKRPENLTRLFRRDVLELCWVGTTAEDQPRFDERWEHLRHCPAAVRFLSVEPQLGGLDIGAALPCSSCGGEGSVPVHGGGKACGACFAWAQGSPTRGPFVDWVIVGGESGPRARPFDLAWARSLVEQCRAARVAAFVKQLGAITVDSAFAERDGTPALIAGMRDRAGADPSEWPEDLRVREWPVPCTGKLGCGGDCKLRCGHAGACLCVGDVDGPGSCPA